MRNTGDSQKPSIPLDATLEMTWVACAGVVVRAGLGPMTFLTISEQGPNGPQALGGKGAWAVTENWLNGLGQQLLLLLAGFFIFPMVHHKDQY